MEASAFRFERVDSSEPLFWKHGLLVSYNIIRAVNCCGKALLLTYCVRGMEMEMEMEMETGGQAE